LKNKEMAMTEQESNSKQIKKENERKIADLMYSITSTLAKEGFRPENHENAIIFKYEGDLFIVHFEEDDPTLFGIDYHIYSFDKQEEYEVLKIVNDLNWRFKYTRFLINDDFHVYVRMAYGVNEASNIEDDFWRMLNAMLSAAHAFRTKMDYKRNISLN
jgi:hypothetical protein